MLKLVIYKKKACIYLVGGTKEAVITLDKTENFYQIFSYLIFTLNTNFWIFMKDFTIKENFIVCLIVGKQQN